MPKRAAWARAGLALAAAASACGVGRAPTVTPTGTSGFFVAGYHPYWVVDIWRDYPWDALDELYFFELEVAGDGSLLDRHGWPDRWLPLIRHAFDEGVQVTPTISLHDPAAFEELMVEPAAVEHLLDGIVDVLAATPGLTGVHLDFEVFQPVAPAARDGYTALVARLVDRLGTLEPRPTLSVFVPAFDDDDAYNERALVALADYIVLQGYDYHSRAGASAGPVAAVSGWGRLNWGYVVDRFLALGAPPRKIVMSVPMYGYEWPTVSAEPGAATRGVGVIVPLTAPADVVPELPRARQQVERHGVLRDPSGASPYYVFRDGEGWRQGWFEDERSLQAKLDFVRRRGLGGVAIFPLAYGDDSDWARLRSIFRN